MGVLLALIDAFSYDYLTSKNTPFLAEMAKEGAVRPLTPMFAFRGIEATAFSGEWPTVHNVWTEFRLRTKRVNQPCGKLLSAGLGFLDRINREYVSKLARLSLTMMFNLCTTKLTPNMIPGKLLPCFEPSMKKPIWHPNSLSVGTIFDWLRSKERTFVCMEPFPHLRDDFATVERFKSLILKRNPSFAWVKLNSLDKAGHTYGPNVSLLQEDLVKTDVLVEELAKFAKKAGLQHVMVMSDHGMSFVRKWHNIMPLLDQLCGDVLFFVDSTMVRFWFQNESQKDKVVDMLKSLSYGRILTAQDMIALKASMDPRYGEIVFALDEGHVFYPDFWNGRKRVKGMHGYAFPESTFATPFLVCNHEMATFLPVKCEDSLEFTNIMPWVLRAMESRAA